MTIVFKLFFGQNFSKISKTHQIAPVLKIFSGEHTPEPPSKRVAAMQIPPLFQKNFEPPPPPRNEILDTPLLMDVSGHFPYMNKQNYRAILCVLVYISIESCV